MSTNANSPTPPETQANGPWSPREMAVIELLVEYQISRGAAAAQLPGRTLRAISVRASAVRKERGKLRQPGQCRHPRFVEGDDCDLPFHLFRQKTAKASAKLLAAMGGRVWA